eukprot:scaffold42374_cov248-Skeletonema_marinoi.AAC.1
MNYQNWSRMKTLVGTLVTTAGTYLLIPRKALEYDSETGITCGGMQYTKISEELELLHQEVIL